MFTELMASGSGGSGDEVFIDTKTATTTNLTFDCGFVPDMAICLPTNAGVDWVGGLYYNSNVSGRSAQYTYAYSTMRLSSAYPITINGTEITFSCISAGYEYTCIAIKKAT